MLLRNICSSPVTERRKKELRIFNHFFFFRHSFEWLAASDRHQHHDKSWCLVYDIIIESNVTVDRFFTLIYSTLCSKSWRWLWDEIKAGNTARVPITKSPLRQLKVLPSIWIRLESELATGFSGFNRKRNNFSLSTAWVQPIIISAPKAQQLRGKSRAKCNWIRWKSINGSFM